MDVHGNSDELEGNLKAHLVQSCSMVACVNGEQQGTSKLLKRSREHEHLEARKEFCQHTYVLCPHMSSKEVVCKTKGTPKVSQKFHISCIKSV